MKKIYSVILFLILTMAGIYSQGFDAGKNFTKIDFDAKDNNNYVVVLKVRTYISGKKSAVKVMYDDKKYVCTQFLPYKENVEEVYINTPLKLTKGIHSIYIYRNSGNWDLEEVKIIPETQEIKDKYTKIPALVTKNPLPVTEKVYNYLWDIQGKGILSGQQMDKGLNEVRAIESVTGKIPSVLGIDLIDFSPTRVERGTKSRIISEAKKWWDEGGLLTCCWHWNAPMNLIDEGPDKFWYSGFYTRATTYDFTIALKDHNSEEYKTLIRDIDAIAVQLKKFQDAGIPLLWRPLHEASGGWFWWGAKGAESYIELYKLLFDRLQNYHNLNNLIWVWNGQSAEWYPGDEYVDVITYDSYPGKNRHTTVQAELEKLQMSTNSRKLVAISENGTVPDINQIAAQQLPWAWFCTWNGDFVIKGRNYNPEYTSEAKLKEFYENEYLITREELPKFTIMENENTRLENFFGKIKKGESVKVISLGGSITTGYNSNPIKTKSWAGLTAEYLNKLGKANNSKVTFYNRGVSGTDSAFAIARLEDHVLSENPDLVIVEFAMNDQWLEPKVRQRTYETILRKLLANPETAVLALFVNERNEPYNSNQKEQQELCEYYKIPYVSWKDCYFTENPAGNFNAFFDGEESIHPNNSGHAKISEYIIQRLNSVYENSTSNEIIKNEGNKVNLPPVQTDSYFEKAIYYHSENITPLENTGWEKDSPVHPEWVKHGNAKKGWQTKEAGSEICFEITGNTIGITYCESDNFRNAIAWVEREDGSTSQKMPLNCFSAIRKGYLGWAYKEIVKSDKCEKFILHIQCSKRASKNAEGKPCNITGILVGRE